ncbi:MAG TPA: hypothetical protein PLS63_12835, partial [Microthrixaceae bacterium]|nr:hypothetical protein [Microthrixaceae bacterium]
MAADRWPPHRAQIEAALPDFVVDGYEPLIDSIELPDPAVPSGRQLAEFRDGRGRSFVLQGPERLALTGANGIGKTRLLQTLIEPAAVPYRDVRAIPHVDRIG